MKPPGWEENGKKVNNMRIWANLRDGPTLLSSRGCACSCCRSLAKVWKIEGLSWLENTLKQNGLCPWDGNLWASTAARKADVRQKRVLILKDCCPLPGDSYVVPFWVVYHKSLVRNEVITERELHRSLQVTRSPVWIGSATIVPEYPSESWSAVAPRADSKHGIP